MFSILISTSHHTAEDPELINKQHLFLSWTQIILALQEWERVWMEPTAGMLLFMATYNRLDDALGCQEQQVFSQLGITLTMAVSGESAWFPAACKPWLKWWPLSKPAHLSAILVVLHGKAYSFLALCRWMSYLS